VADRSKNLQALPSKHQQLDGVYRPDPQLAVAALSACQRRSAALPVPGEQFEFGRCRKSSLSRGTESRANHIPNADVVEFPNANSTPTPTVWQDLRKQLGRAPNRRAEDQVTAALAAAAQIPDDRVNFLGDPSEKAWEAAVFSVTLPDVW
jgi:hypothetical protein